MYEHPGERPDGGVLFRPVVTPEAAGGKTKIALRADFGTAEEFQRAKAIGSLEGGGQKLARLDVYAKAKAA